jgi:hypothetical protein
MELYEMLIDGESLEMGVNAISIVEDPAIGLDFIALNDQSKVALAKVSDEKRILMGAALVPDKPIYRNQDGNEFYIYFSKETVRQTAELFFKNSNHKNATLEHNIKLNGMTIFESWIVEDSVHDKSAKYGLSYPEGTWVVTMKVDDDNIWDEYVKNEKVFGFSIEGQFANALRSDLGTDLSNHELEAAIEKMKSILTDYFKQ